MAALLLLAAIALGVAAFLALEEISRPLGERRAALDRIGAYRRPDEVAVRRPASAGRLAEPLARLSRTIVPRRSSDAVAAQLVAAGLGGRLSVDAFLSVELMTAAALAATGVAIGAAGGAATALLLAVVLGTIGFAAPRLALRLRTKRRVERICAELPDALDLLTVSVSAGLGLDAAMARLADTTSGAFAEELALVLTETRIGEGRAQALQRLADRIRAPEVRTFVRALIQGEQLGIPLAETLRVQAVESRRRRRAASEEKAGKAAVKMIFPTALFIFPALFVVILAPAILSMAGRL